MNEIQIIKSIIENNLTTISKKKYKFSFLFLFLCTFFISLYFFIPKKKLIDFYIPHQVIIPQSTLVINDNYKFINFNDITYKIKIQLVQNSNLLKFLNDYPNYKSYFSSKLLNNFTDVLFEDKKNLRNPPIDNHYKMNFIFWDTFDGRTFINEYLLYTYNLVLKK